MSKYKPQREHVCRWTLGWVGVNGHKGRACQCGKEKSNDKRPNRRT